MENAKEVRVVKNMKGRKNNGEKPWITQDLLQKTNLRDILFNLQDAQSTDENKEQYRVFRNALNSFFSRG